MIRFYNYKFSSYFDLMLTRPFHYLGESAPYEGALCIVELHCTKVHVALRMAKIQNTEVDNEYWQCIVTRYNVHGCITKVQHTKVESTRWMVGVSIVISIEILKSYGFTILVASNDYDSTQNRSLVKSGKIAHL